MDTATSGRLSWTDRYQPTFPQGADYLPPLDIGFVFQFYNLVQNPLTAIENVELATQICKHPLDPETVLKQVGLKTGGITSPLSFPAASSSGYPSPGRWPRTPNFCSAMTSTGALDYRQEGSFKALAGYLLSDGHDGGGHHP